MPIFTWKCVHCGHTFEGLVWQHDALPPCPQCGGDTEKTYFGYTPTMIPDTVPGGMVIENIAKTPMRFDSKSDYRRELERRGMSSSGTDGLASSRFRHMGDPGEGSDKARAIYDPVKGRTVVRSTNWASGPPPGVDPRPSCMLSPDEQAQRRADWLATEPADAPIIGVTFKGIKLFDTMPTTVLFGLHASACCSTLKMNPERMAACPSCGQPALWKPKNQTIATAV